MVFPKGFTGSRNFWGDLPSDRHDGGANVSFADGSVQFWKWATPKKWKQYGQTAQGEDANDLAKIQKAVRPLNQ